MLYTSYSHPSVNTSICSSSTYKHVKIPFKAAHFLHLKDPPITAQIRHIALTEVCLWLILIMAAAKILKKKALNSCWISDPHHSYQCMVSDSLCYTHLWTPPALLDLGVKSGESKETEEVFRQNRDLFFLSDLFKSLLYILV